LVGSRRIASSASTRDKLLSRYEYKEQDTKEAKVKENTPRTKIRGHCCVPHKSFLETFNFSELAQEGKTRTLHAPPLPPQKKFIFCASCTLYSILYRTKRETMFDFVLLF
jgi:hypothetical protein